MGLAADATIDYLQIDSEKAVMAFSNGLREPEGHVQPAVVQETNYFVMVKAKEAPLRALIPNCLHSLTVLVICMSKATC